MKNFREVKDDLLKECIEYREETIFAIMNEEDKKHEIRYDEITEKIFQMNGVNLYQMKNIINYRLEMQSEKVYRNLIWSQKL